MPRVRTMKEWIKSAVSSVVGSKGKPRSVPLKPIIVLLYSAGVIWTLLHPIVSVVTGELKCRGSYIDESALGTHFRVDPYPSEKKLGLFNIGGGLCESVGKSLVGDQHNDGREQIDASCKVHGPLEVAKIIPSSASVEPVESVVLFYSGFRLKKNNQTKSDTGSIMASVDESILQLMSRLSTPSTSPWLAKIIYIVSPRADLPETNSMDDTVEMFLNLYLGPIDSLSSSDSLPVHVPPLLLLVGSTLIRNIIVLDLSSSSSSSSNEVNVLAQGRRGLLPNMDLVFATISALTRNDIGSRQTSRLLGGNTNDIGIHPFRNTSRKLEQWAQSAFKKWNGQLDNADDYNVEKQAWFSYLRDLVGLGCFLSSMALGP